MQSNNWWKTILILFFLSCGKKAPPPSPDRWAPKVGKVEAIDKFHIKVRFTEKVDKESAENTANYKISGLNIYRAILQSDGRTVLLSTSIQKDTIYAIEIFEVKDVAGNKMKEIKMKIKGSTKEDTSKPVLLTKLRKWNKVIVDSVFHFSFNEKISGYSFLVLPSCSSFCEISNCDVNLFVRPDAGEYHQVIFWVKDLSGNKSDLFEFIVTREKEKPSLSLKVYADSGSIVVLSRDGEAYRTGLSCGVIEFSNLEKGEYEIYGVKGGFFGEKKVELYEMKEESLSICDTLKEVKFERVINFWREFTNKK